ncbi:hypothetical protein [Shewanella waksmanii]|uniref:hypothetical protein n=1 Tax=Shewanella waksmanii TaxID=213783 RepID=UPI00048F0BA4|nr:hypothetical protein [Shewanella waksmanii]
MSDKAKQLEQMVNALPKEIEPANSQWSDIEHRLTPQQQRLSPQFALAAVLVLGLAIGYLMRPLGLTEPNAELIATIEAIELQHQAQVASLTEGHHLVDLRDNHYQPIFNDGIEQLRAAAKELYNNLTLNPTDKQLWQMWLWTQKREIELLKQMQQLPKNTVKMEI